MLLSVFCLGRLIEARSESSDAMVNSSQAVPPAHGPIPWDPPIIFRANVGTLPRGVPWDASWRRKYPRPGQEVLVRHEGETEEEKCRLFLMRDENPRQAYKIMQYRCSDSLGEKGDIHYCLRVNRVNTNDGRLLFEEPTMVGNMGTVVVQIKALRYDQMNDNRQGRRETLNREISAMQRFGGHDEQHIMECIEALSDDERLYIVTPWAAKGNLETKFEAVIRQSSTPYNNLAALETNSLMLNNVRQRQARKWFSKVVNNVIFIQRQRMAHRNIKPTNIVVQKNERTTLTGLSMSVLIPHNDQRRHLIVPDEVYPDDSFQRRFPYMAPEMYLHLTKNKTPSTFLTFLSDRETTLPESKKKRPKNWEYDGFALDVWALGVALYRLLAGELPPYEIPHPTDLGYKHIILGRGLIDDQNELWAREDDEIRVKMESVRRKIDRNTRRLLSGMLDPNYKTRFTLAEVLEHLENE